MCAKIKATLNTAVDVNKTQYEGTLTLNPVVLGSFVCSEFQEICCQKKKIYKILENLAVAIKALGKQGRESKKKKKVVQSES